ncbi:MAG: TlpA family protein disulfide reductase [Phycisphaerales bacterium]|nr:TlpA family protein disulfide reductase [Phycisphaerales bacterium]MCI0630184.1 TlpA family protein disulfide reductase [Phycisphaerales bacterium]
MTLERIRTNWTKALAPAVAIAAVMAIAACQPDSSDPPPSDAAQSASRVKDTALKQPSEPAPAQVGSRATTSFPDEYFYFGSRRSAALRNMEGQQAKPLTVKNWIGEAQTLSDLKGKIVVVDFWATWCRPCVNALPHNVELVNQYKERDVVFIGVHDAKRGSESMATVAQQSRINYSLAVDDGGQSARAYNVTFWPTYVVLDRQGVVRAAGLEPGSVERVIEKLLAEN